MTGTKEEEQLCRANEIRFRGKETNKPLEALKEALRSERVKDTAPTTSGQQEGPLPKIHDFAITKIFIRGRA